MSANSVPFFWGWNLEDLLWRGRRATGLQGNSSLVLFWGHSRSLDFNLSCKKPLKTAHQAKEHRDIIKYFILFASARLETMQITTFISLIKPETEKKRRDHEKEEGEREENFCWFLHTSYMRKPFPSSGLHRNLLLWSMMLCRKCSQFTFVTNTIGFNPNSQLWHHTISSVSGNKILQNKLMNNWMFSPFPDPVTKLPVITFRIPFPYLSNWIFFLPFSTHLLYDFIFIFSTTHSLVGNICLPYISIVNFTNSIYFQIRISNTFVIPFFLPPLQFSRYFYS